MSSELIAVLRALLDYMLLLSAQLALVLALRVPVARYLGATTAYRLWALPLLWLPVYLLQQRLPPLAWPEFLRTNDAVQGSVSWFPLALQQFELPPALVNLDLLPLRDTGAGSLWPALFTLWLALAALLLTQQLLRIRQFNRALQQQCEPGTLSALEHAQVPHGLPLQFLRGLASPALYGVLRPCLLLPSDFTQRFDARIRALILRHEAVHYCRRDNLWNLMAMLLRVSFWFNPLLHIAWQRFRLDQELSCDELALQGTHPDEGKQYARTLLESMSGHAQGSQPATITAWGNLRELRERTHMIKHRLTHKPHYTVGRCLLVLCLLTGGMATTLYEGAVPQALAVEESAAESTLSRAFYEGMEQVMQARDSNDYAAASALLDSLALRDMNPREYYTLALFRANLAQIQDEYAQALLWYQEMLAIPGLSQEQRQMPLMAAGSLYYLLEDYSTAIDYFQRFLDTSEDPQPEATLRIAYAYYLLGDYENCIPYAEQAIELGEDDHNTYSFLRAAYLTMDNIEDGRRVNQKMLELFDDDEDEKLEAQFMARYGESGSN